MLTRSRGIYVEDDERWPKHFRGMGIRIEDSVCIQEETPLILTTEAVKEVCYNYHRLHPIPHILMLESGC